VVAAAWAALPPLEAPVTLRLTRTSRGARFDAAPERRTDVWIGRGTPFDARARRDVNDSRTLDAVLPASLAESPDTAALYFLSGSGVVRYAPPIGLHRILPADVDFTQQPIFTRALPTRTPSGRTVWTSPYLDDAGHGLLVTASTPAYLHGEFRGIVAADVSLTRLAERLRDLKPTPGGFAVLLDTQGHVVAAPDRALVTLLGRPAPRGARGVLTLNLLDDPSSALHALRVPVRERSDGLDSADAHGAPFLVAHARLPTLGWTLLTFAPRDEITAQYAEVAGTIARGSSRTLNSTLLVLLASVALTLLVVERLARVTILAPIARLTRLAHIVKGGQLDERLLPESSEEFRVLARSFNGMLDALKSGREALRIGEERYELAVRGSNDGLWDWKVATGDVYLSARWKAMLGYRTGELPDHLDTWTALLHPDDRARVSTLLRTHLEGPGDLLEYEARLKHSDGSYRWILTRAATLRDVSGRATRLSGSTSDVTERVEALRLLEERVDARTRDLEGVLSVTRDFTYATSRARTLDRLASNVAAAAGADAAVVSLDATATDVGAVGRHGLPDDADLTVVLPVAGAVERADEAARVKRTASWPAVVQVPLTRGGERLGWLVTCFGSEGEVDAARVHLLVGIAGQAAVVAENARLFASASDRAALAERQKLARDLHDSVSQALYGIALGGRTTLRQLERAPDQVEASVRYMLSLAEAGLAEMRALIFELRPESLEQEGLSMALAKLASALHARHGLEVTLDLGEEPALPFDVKVALLRVAQEATHNVVKHASASSVDLRLKVTQDAVTLEVHDDGVGFDVLQVPEGRLGQTSMRERAEMVGATCRVISEAGVGTLVRVVVPQER
ncbi:PAS domain-containing protein, partial [Deinococcus pimensis]|uniref:PAS domain-containing protein n=1 Tax=Deinococcus pimensis TaxID=309888 RepID=UPI00146FC3B1